MSKYVMAMDAGTTSNRCIIFDHSRTPVAVAQKEFRQIYPQAGWVEHDAMEIWNTQLEVAREAMKKAGITAEDIGTDDSRVKCYGYLRKDNHVECGIYYDLMCRARVFCNPTPEWAGFSSTVEAMFFFTPVVVSKYDNFVAEFGNDIDFGKYNVSFSMSAVAGDILTVVDSPAYDTKCVIAHDSVREYTWESFVDRLGLGG